ERAGSLAAGVLAQRLRDLEERASGNSACLFDHFRGVAGEVTLQKLEDAAGVLQREVFLAAEHFGAARSLTVGAVFRVQPLVARGRNCSLDALVLPRPRIVSLFGIPAAEESFEVLGVFEPLVDDRRRVRVVDDVILEVALVLQDVAHDSPKKRDVRAGSNRNVQVGDGAGTRETRVYVDDRRASIL